MILIKVDLSMFEDKNSARSYLQQTKALFDEIYPNENVVVTPNNISIEKLDFGSEAPIKGNDSAGYISW